MFSQCVVLWSASGDDLLGFLTAPNLVQLYKICFANFEASVWHAKGLRIAHRPSVLDGRHQLSLEHGHEVTSRR